MSTKLSKGPRFDPGRIRFWVCWGLYLHGDVLCIGGGVCHCTSVFGVLQQSSVLEKYIYCALGIVFCTVAVSGDFFGADVLQNSSVLEMNDMPLQS